VLTPTWAVITGGGTAGHVQPGLAVAAALVDRGHDARSIAFVGSRRGMESSLVPEAGFAIKLLPGRGIVRQLSWSNVGAVAGLLVAGLRSVAWLNRMRPEVIVVVGGYAAVACGLAGVALRIPVVVMEQNAVPGLANRLIGRWARVCAVSFPGTDLPRSALTGNPVRPEVLAVDRESDGAAARRALGVPPGRKFVAIFGGSLGARRINVAASQAALLWAERSDLAVRHIVGRRDWDASMADAHRNDHLAYVAVDYEARMDLVLAAADLVVCRAGATSVAEVATVGVACVLVPLRGAPGDHQTANAEALVAAGAAVMVTDTELDGPSLAATVDDLVGDPARLATMGNAARACAHRNAAQRVAELVETHARPRRNR